jgi:putative hydrolase of the HAD superfamily
MRRIVFAVDGDDTLWHNEHHMAGATDRFTTLLADASGHTVSDTVAAFTRIQAGNISLYGFGVKSLALSMIETALDLVGDNLDAGHLRAILDWAKTTLAEPVDLIADAETSLARLAAAGDVILITKGDLLDQERKAAASGLGDHLAHIRVVADKTAATYRQVFGDLSIDPHDATMIGNSYRSDVAPVLEMGGRAIWVPYPITWEYEADHDEPEPSPRWATVENLTGAVDLALSWT